MWCSLIIRHSTHGTLDFRNIIITHCVLEHKRQQTIISWWHRHCATEYFRIPEETLIFNNDAVVQLKQRISQLLRQALKLLTNAI